MDDDDDRGSVHLSIDDHQIIGGIEGDSSHGTLVLYSVNDGQELIVCTGPGLNHWLIGMDECMRRIHDLIFLAKRECEIPDTKQLVTVGLCMTGSDPGGIMNRELEIGLLKKYPLLSKSYFIADLLQGALMSVCNDAGGIIVRSHVGSAGLLMNPDGTLFRTGGWGHILGDEGSAFWISMKAIKIVFDEMEHLDYAPNFYSIEVIWDAIKRYFGVVERYELLPFMYRNFKKEKIAGLYKRIARGAKRNDKLCKWIFNEAGRHLAKLVLGLLPNTDISLKEANEGLKVFCTGSVWNDWDLIKYGFVMEMDNELMIQEYKLLRAKSSGAHGAALLAARLNMIDITIPPQQAEIFYYYNRDHPGSTTIFPGANMVPYRGALVSKRSIYEDRDEMPHKEKSLRKQLIPEDFISSKRHNKNECFGKKLNDESSQYDNFLK